MVTGWVVENEVVTIGAVTGVHWLACEHPERPWDDRVAYHVKPACGACLIAMKAHRLNRAPE